jgi:hypothetical protein
MVWAPCLAKAIEPWAALPNSSTRLPSTLPQSLSSVSVGMSGP